MLAIFNQSLQKSRGLVPSLFSSDSILPLASVPIITSFLAHQNTLDELHFDVLDRLVRGGLRLEGEEPSLRVVLPDPMAASV